MEYGRAYTVEDLRVGLEDEDNEITYRKNGNRPVDGDVFLRKIESIAPRVGIKRVADISFLTFNNYSVFQAVRPNVYSHWQSGQNTGAQGKGPTPTQAKISALMECIEGACAEPKNETLIRGSYESLRHQNFLLPPSAFVSIVKKDEDSKFKQSDFAVNCNDRLMWTKALHVESGREVLIPAETVFFPFFPTSFNTVPRFPTSSNGLASGATYLDAVIHAIYELIERHYIYLYEDLNSDIEIEAIYEEEYFRIDDIRERLDNKFELQLIAFKRPHCSNPAFIRCSLVDEDGNSFDGWGCCFNVEMAIERAISEALQSLATVYSGAREDIDEKCYNRDEDNPHAEEMDYLSRFPEFRSLRIEDYKKQVINKDYKSLTEEYHDQINWLKENGHPDICIANLTRVGIDIPVVKVVVANMICKKSLLNSYSISSFSDMLSYSYSFNHE